MVRGKEGILLYGGVTWPDVNMTASDAVLLERVAWLDACKKRVEALIEKQQKYDADLPMMGIDDIGTETWRLMYKRTRDDCFNEDIYPAFPSDTRVLSYNENIYVMPTENCIEDCNQRGSCTVGRCTCMNGYYGDAC